MRKVLLATTALVAMSVTAAHADVSVSGGMDFQYSTADNADDSASVDGNIKIVGTVVTDTGLSIAVTQNNSLQTAASQVEDAFMTVAGDFGTVILGQTDMVNDRNDGVLGINTDVFTLQPVAHGTLIGTDTSDSTAANLGFESPSMNGMKVYAGAVPNGGSQVGASFGLVRSLHQLGFRRLALHQHIPSCRSLMGFQNRGLQQCYRMCLYQSRYRELQAAV